MAEGATHAGLAACVDEEEAEASGVVAGTLEGHVVEVGEEGLEVDELLGLGYAVVLLAPPPAGEDFPSVKSYEGVGLAAFWVNHDCAESLRVDHERTATSVSVR